MAVFAGVFFFTSKSQAPQNEKSETSTPVTSAQKSEYNPTIDPANFAPQVTNKYYTLKPGTKFTYKESTKDGVEKIEVVVTNETKKVMGVTTIVVRDTVWLDDKMKEDTIDLYAQDKDGNVWYFGEQVDNYKDGKVKDHSGSWEAGIDGALPGIVMRANPKVGDSYRQEYYRGEAEDMGDVVALNQKVTVPYGTLDNCLQTRDWSQIDNKLNEYKYYCPSVGFLVAGDSVKEPGSEKLELLSISTE